jgi:hypothetical protein
LALHLTWKHQAAQRLRAWRQLQAAWRRVQLRSKLQVAATQAARGLRQAKHLAWVARSRMLQLQKGQIQQMPNCSKTATLLHHWWRVQSVGRCRRRRLLVPRLQALHKLQQNQHLPLLGSNALTLCCMIRWAGQVMHCRLRGIKLMSSQSPLPYPTLRSLEPIDKHLGAKHRASECAALVGNLDAWKHKH